MNRLLTKREAIQLLLDIDQTTVIDENWFDYFMKDMSTLIALLVVTELNNYKEILSFYEGYTITELINALVTKSSHFPPGSVIPFNPDE